LRALEHRGVLEQNDVTVGAWTQVVLRRLVIDQFRRDRRQALRAEVDIASLEAPASEPAPRWMAIPMEQLLAAVRRCPPVYAAFTSFTTSRVDRTRRSRARCTCRSARSERGCAGLAYESAR
jgi:hypothetical protein